jgi:hypothetical protein
MLVEIRVFQIFKWIASLIKLKRFYLFLIFAIIALLPPGKISDSKKLLFMKRMNIVFYMLMCMFLGIYAQPENDVVKRLIVRGDDIGSFHAANLGCIDSYTKGIMTSTEIMVPCPWFEEAVHLLNSNKGLDVGIHLTLTSEWSNYKWRPLTYSPGLMDEHGYFYPQIWKQEDMPEGTALRPADWTLQEIEDEFRAQIEKALARLPHASHLTGHMGSYNWDEDVKKVYRKLAKEYDLDIDPGDYGVKRLKVEGWNKDAGYEEKLDLFIEALKGMNEGTYLFVEHPAYNTKELESINHTGYTGVGKDREIVTKVWTHPRVLKTIEEENIQLISYKELKN